MDGEDRSRVADEELARRVRSGDDHAFGVLWERHARAGLTAAGSFRSIAEPEDIVAEAYLRILRAMQGGGGPHEAFRPYLYRTIRNVALGWKPDSASVGLDDVAETADDRPGPEEAAADNTITVRAFRTLPERWRTVLWYTEVEGMEPADAAPLLGLTANATAALAYRARDGLKKSWLQAHVNEQRVPPECRWTTQRMGEYARGGLTPRARVRFAEHLKTCARCSILLEEVDQLSGRLAAILFPIVLGGVAGSTLLAQTAASGSGAGSAPSAAGRGTHGPTVLAATGPSRLVVGLLVVAAVVLVGGAAFALPALLPHGDSASLSRPGAAPAPAASASESAVTAPAGQPPAVAAPSPAPTPATPPRPVPPVIAPPLIVPIPDTSAPGLPVVIAPVDAVLTSVASPLFTGTGEPGAVVRVQRLAADGTTVLDETASATVGTDGSWAAATAVPIPDGAQSFLVTQTDAAGNVSSAVHRTMTVDTVAAPPSIDAPAPGPLLWLPDVTGAAEPGAVVELADENGAALGTATADGSGAWSIPLPDPGRDGESVTAVQTDPAGNRSAASAATAPFDFTRPQILTPADRGTVPTTGGSTSVQVQIAGVEGMQVEVFVDGVGTGNIHTLEATPILRVTQPLADGPHAIGVRYVDRSTGRVGSFVTTAFTIG